jgi:hypothetical protein
MRKHKHILSALTFFAFGLASTAAFANQDCNILSLEEVVNNYPYFKPWKVTNGGDGACMFEGQRKVKGGGTTTVILTLTQLMQQSAKEAQEMMRTMTESYRGQAGDFKVEPKLGNSGFIHATKDDSMTLITWWAHRDRAALNGLLSAPTSFNFDADARQELIGLMDKALANSTTARAYAAAASCDYLDAALLKQLMPGKPEPKMQQFGNNSCMATGANEAVVIFSRIDSNPSQYGMFIESSSSTCKLEKAPDVGAAAHVSHSCTAGNPTASVNFLKDNFMHDISLTTSKEPSAAQRAVLVKMAQNIMKK